MNISEVIDDESDVKLKVLKFLSKFLKHLFLVYFSMY